MRLGYLSGTGALGLLAVADAAGSGTPAFIISSLSLALARAAAAVGGGTVKFRTKGNNGNKGPLKFISCQKSAAMCYDLALFNLIKEKNRGVLCQTHV
jgi:hypothetical protein